MAKFGVIITGIALVVSALVGSSPTAGAAEARDRVAGEAVAKELCSGCHIVAEGQRGPVADGVPPFPIIAERPGRTTGYLQAYLSSPTPPMPHLPLSKREIDSVIAYIRSFAD